MSGVSFDDLELILQLEVGKIMPQFPLNETLLPVLSNYGKHRLLSTGRELSIYFASCLFPSSPSSLLVSPFAFASLPSSSLHLFGLCQADSLKRFLNPPLN